MKNTIKEIIKMNLGDITMKQINEMYKQAQRNQFKDYEDSELYSIFDNLYSDLGYEYGYSDTLLSACGVECTSDLIDLFMSADDTKQVTNIYNVELKDDSTETGGIGWVGYTLYDFICETDLYIETVDSNGNINASDFYYIEKALIKNGIKPISDDEYSLNLHIRNGFIYSKSLTNNKVLEHA